MVSMKLSTSLSAMRSMSLVVSFKGALERVYAK